ncbi:MAG: DNA polymerase IV [Lachnospiraceae bacterium]|nr:DNA polymerase IV [Lachnospiraceae bacterium]
MDRTILHSDMNNCYASIELAQRPELRGMPLVVGGDPEKRHGIVLAKDQLAKQAGIKTGMALWQARQVCPDVVIVPPRMDVYLKFSGIAQEIYAEYTDRQEAFGVDEAWLDVTESCALKGEGPAIAQEIRRRIKRELGITVSIGVSWNKIFAKLGSDYKKPDAVTVIHRENYRQLVWPLGVQELLGVGYSTQRTLNKYGIHTIGDLAKADPAYLERWLGKMGRVLRVFARGEDITPVSLEHMSAPIKSIGNSTTTPRDITTQEDAVIVIYLLAESVAARLRENHFMGEVVELSVRDKDLYRFTRQRKLARPTNLSGEIAGEAMRLFREHVHWEKPIRSMGVRVAGLMPDTCPVQLDLFCSQRERDKQYRMEAAVDEIRRRFGFYAIQRGVMYTDRSLSALNAKEEHVVRPHGYMEWGNRTGVIF